jgi:hypothetical protein
MIRYALQCAKSHAFESWFRDSTAFDEQSAAGQITCPVCGSDDVSKALMAPAVRTSRKRGSGEARETVVAEPAPSQAPVPVALADEQTLKLRTMMRAFRDHLVANSADVGPKFAEEARRIHDGEAEGRAIRGQASPEEVRSLLDDGIDIMPLPVLPEDRN